MQALQTVYKDDASKKTCVYKWIERFWDGREAVEDDEGHGRPTTSKNNEKIDFVRNLVKEDGRLMVYQIVETVGISVGSDSFDSAWRFMPQQTFGAMGAKSIALQISSISEVNCKSRFCSKLKQMKTAFLIELSQKMKHGSHQYDHETKQQSKQWLPCGSSGPIKFKSERSVKKVMSNCFLGLWRSCASRFFRRVKKLLQVPIM